MKDGTQDCLVEFVSSEKIMNSCYAQTRREQIKGYPGDA